MLNKEEIVVKYLSGELSPTEKQELDAWLAESEENETELNKWQQIWNDSKLDVDDFSPDVDAAWGRVSQSVDQMAPIGKAALEPQIKQVSLTSFILRIAAVLIIGATVVWTAYEISEEAKPGIAWTVKFTEAGQRSEIQLADGSKIYLNTDSKLEYPESFAADLREVRLAGEAYFDIAPNPDRPFVIKTSNTHTQVLGTSFNIEAYPDNDQVIVSVTSGQVLFSEEGNETNQVDLTQGFQGVFSGPGQEVLRQEYANTNFIAWQTGILTFDHTPLSQAAETLSEFYGKSIIIRGDSFGRCRLTSTFDNQPLSEVLEVIELVLEAQVRNEDNQVIITGAGCHN